MGVEPSRVGSAAVAKSTSGARRPAEVERRCRGLLLFAAEVAEAAGGGIGMSSGAGSRGS